MEETELVRPTTTMTKSQFKEIVIDDILGNINPVLREETVVRHWLNALLEIKTETFIKLSLLDDAETQQGSMNHPLALEKVRVTKDKLVSYQYHTSLRVYEAKQLIKSIAAYSVLKGGLNSPDKVVNSLRKQVRDLQIEVNDLRALFLTSSILLDKALVDAGKAVKKLKQLKEDKHFTHQLVWKELQSCEYFLSRVIMQWEDNTFDDSLIEEIKNFKAWDVPFGVSPKEARQEDLIKGPIAIHLAS